jgi:hypothetical protein
VPTYRAYHLAADGHFVHVTELECRNDSEAISEAQLIENDNGLELWIAKRMVRAFPPLDLSSVSAPRDRPDGAGELDQRAMD